MFRALPSGPWRILIASSHPLFAEGLRSLLHKRPDTSVDVVGIVSNLDEAIKALQRLHPDLVIVDYDDDRVNRDEFLARFVEGEGRLRVVLLSLREGGDEAIVYDRRTLVASNVDDWLQKWTDTRETVNEAVLALPGGGEERTYPKRRDNMKHFIGAGLFVIVIAVAGFFALGRAHLLPIEASLQAQWIDGLFNLHFKLIVLLFSLIVGLLLYSVIFFRRRPGDTTDGPHIEGSTPLEVTWTLVPLAAVLYIAYIGSAVLGETTRADPQPLEVNVIGSQWSWRFEYPEWGISDTKLTLPANKQVLLHMSSTDVIHSFWVPEFRVKQDALPGGDQFVRDLRITPNKPGSYKVRCAELCGRNHAYMLADVNVVTQVDFDTWVQSQLAPQSNDPVARGKAWANQYGCTACHSFDGSENIGPTWKGLYGSEVPLEDGTTVTADHDYLFESIRHPGEKIVAGFHNVMPPNIAADMTDEQINDVIAFIESLK